MEYETEKKTLQLENLLLHSTSVCLNDNITFSVKGLPDVSTSKILRRSFWKILESAHQAPILMSPLIRLLLKDHSNYRIR